MLWRKRKSSVDPTFKKRVEQFWDWYAKNSIRIFQAIEEGNFDEVHAEVSDNVAAMWSHLAWVFGPGPEEKGGHSFTISGEGILSRQFLADYWKSRAPELEGWTFYASRQPGEIRPGIAIEMDGEKFDFDGLWITPELDEEDQVVHITAWHPSFTSTEDNRRDTALFIMLDEVLGEHGTDQWIGRITKADTRLDGAFPALELRDYLHDLEIERGWKKLPPTESYTTYQVTEPDDRFLRSDTISGSTCHMRLVGEYLEAKGPIPHDEIEGSGAEFVFVAFPSEMVPLGGEVDYRSTVEEALGDVLASHHSGRILGGAIGLIHCYIDLILFDGDRSLEILARTLRELGLSDGSSIQSFIQGSEGRRVML